MNGKKPIEKFDDEHPLDLTEKESERANQALRDYAMMGSRRSLHALEERYKLLEEDWKKNKKRTGVQRPPSTRWMTISEWSAHFRWQDRVAVYDEQIRQQELAEFQSDRMKWRKHRLNAAKNLLSKAIIELNNLPGNTSNLGQISRALQTAMEELRAEFGEDQANAATPLTQNITTVEIRMPMSDEDE